MDDPPKRIDGMDISHLGGTETVASCVVFLNGTPRKSEYRTYKIRSVEDGTPDDFNRLREVVRRRYKRMVNEGGPWPDLLVGMAAKGSSPAR